jgi:hypothetical protein
MTRSSEIGVAAALGPLVTFGVAAALVGVRGEVRPEVIAVALAATVALCGRFGGRQGGVAAALMAATSFDFLHTKPYMSLKIANGSDILVTVLLLGVGLVVGGLAGQAFDARRSARDNAAQDRLRRVLAVARDGDAGEVETAVCAEIADLLELRSCRFAPEPGDFSVVGPDGALEHERLVFAVGRGRGGFELPPEGVALEVTAHRRRFGYLLCLPSVGVGVSISARRTAVDLVEILALAMGARASTS